LQKIRRMANLKSVFKNTFFYSFSSIILRASSIIFFPIFSSYLTKADYGIMAITQMIVTIIISTSCLQLPKGITRYLYEKDAEQENYEKRLMGSSFLIAILFNLILVALLIPFGNWLFSPVLNEIRFFPYMAYALATVPFMIVYEQYKGLLMAKHIGAKVFKLDMSFFGSNIALNLLLVVVFKMDALGIILSNLICSFSFALYAILVYYRKTVLRFDFRLMKPVFKFSIPLIPFFLAGFLLTSVDSIYLNRTNGVEISGIYYIALTFSTIFSMFKESFNFAFTPWFYENFKENNHDYIRKLLNIIFWGAGFFCIGVSIFGYEILSLLSSNPELLEAWKYIPLSTIGLLVIFIGQVYTMFVYHGKKNSKYLFISNFAGFAVNLGLCFAFTSFFNAYWALIARNMGFLVLSLIQIIIAMRSTEYRFDSLNVILVVLVCGSLSFIHYLPVNYVLLIFIKLFIIGGFTFLLYRMLVNMKIAPVAMARDYISKLKTRK